MLLSGATGFLGLALAKALLAGGWPADRLRCLVRDPDRAKKLGLPAASLWQADLGRAGSEASLAEAAVGAQVVVHLAGSLKAYGKNGYRAVNVVGSRRLYAAVAAQAPLAFVVHVSSLAAAGPSTDGRASAAPAAACRPVSAYGTSKLRGELELLRSGLSHTIVRPPVVYGPGDAATRMLLQQSSATRVWLPKNAAPLSVIHVQDVVLALLLAIDRRPHGAVLPLDGPARTDTHEFTRAIAKACGVQPKFVPVSLRLAAVAALAADVVARVRRRPSYFNRDKVRELAAPGWVADGEPARRALGFLPNVALHEGLAAVVRAEGFVREPAATSATA